jgi:hypothetical protein
MTFIPNLANFALKKRKFESFFVKEEINGFITIKRSSKDARIFYGVVRLVLRKNFK